MEVVIGVQLTNREIRLEIDDEDGEDLRKRIDKVLKESSKDNQALWITDRDGRHVAVPADKLAYVEVGADKGGKRVGFTAPD